MPPSPIIFFAGGGTGGHLYPGIAVAQALRGVMPDAKAIFLCTQREIDRTILEPTGFEFVPQPIVPPITTAGGLLRFWKGWRETKDLVRRLLREHQPAAVLGLGGYAAGVAVKQAAAKGVPCAVLNPDVVPGKANQFLVKSVRAVCCQFESTADYLSPADRPKFRLTGCPIREEIAHGATGAAAGREGAAARLGLDPLLNTLVVTGASLGAQTINEAVLTLLADVTLRGWQILHLSGRDHADSVRAGYRELAQKTPINALVVDFTPAMSDVWAVADLAISRSGASSCAELTACGVPSILMPYPFHKDKHQSLNAAELVKAGAAVLIDDEKERRKNAARLKPLVESLLYDADRRRSMREAALRVGKPRAACEVATLVAALTAEPRPGQKT